MHNREWGMKCSDGPGGAQEGETMVCSVVKTQEQRKAFF